MLKCLQRRRFIATALALGLPLALPSLAFAQTSATRTISPAIVHENLAIYFVRGPSAGGVAPLTLAEALQRGVFTVHETGNVNALQVENTGDEPVFIQSGDIVKGGQQDRVLTVSMVVPPRSGRMPIDAFCVEQGRWSARGKEQVGRFEASNASMPSRQAKLAMKAPPVAEPSGAARTGQPRTDTSSRQLEVWREVARKQDQLARSVGAAVAAPQSRTSLQLTLENERLNGARAAYAKALRTVGEDDGDIIGYVFAINGKINSGDVYSSNALFRKMWLKMLDASITEALGEKPDMDKSAAPEIATVAAFLDAADTGEARQRDIAGIVDLETRSAGGTMQFDTRLKGGGIVHRNYLRMN